MGRLILHLGVHKTGSSAVQLWLVQNAARLATAGIIFPAEFTGRTGNAAKLARAITLTPERHEDELPHQLRRRFLEFCQRQSGKDVVVSAEAFETELLPSLKRAGGSGAGLAQRVDNVRTFAEDAGFSGVTVVYLVRNIVDRSNSQFAQRVKAMVHSQYDARMFNPETFAYHDRAVCNLLMERHGFKVAVDVLDPDAVSVADQIMRLAGLDARVAAIASLETPRANESIGELGVLAGLHLNGVVQRGPDDDLPRRRKTMSQALRLACRGVKDRPFNGFAPQDAARVVQRQAAFDQKMSPWLTARQLTMIAEPRRIGPRSPVSVEALGAEQAETVRAILGRVADIMCSGENTALGYRRDDIMSVRAFPPVAETVGPDHGATRPDAPSGATQRRQQDRNDVAGPGSVTYPAQM